MKLLIVLAVVVGVLLLAALLWQAQRSGGVRRAEFRRAKAERDLALSALDKIEAKASTYLELESVLATDVRSIIHQTREERSKLK